MAKMELKLSEREIQFCSMLLDPLASSEVFFTHRNSSWFKFRKYQIEMMLETKSLRCAAARGIGKTVTLEAIVPFICLTQRNKETLITTPNMAHLRPLMERIINRITSNRFLYSNVKRLVRSPEYYIEFVNGHKLHARIAGAKGGQSILSLHVDNVFVDEAQLYGPRATYTLQGALKTGCKIFLFGVPNGVKLNYLYREKDNNDFVQYHFNKFDDPSFTEQEHQRLLKVFGGKNSQMYKNQVLGIDGEEQFTTFPESNWSACTFTDEYDYDFQIIDNPSLGMSAIRVPIKPLWAKEIVMAIDIGYSPDPTVILFFAINDENTYVLFHKLILKKIPVSYQAKAKEKVSIAQPNIINYFANMLNVSKVSLDVGGIGRSIAMDLIDASKFQERSYSVTPVDFGGLVEIGRSDGKPIKQRVKFFSTLQLQALFEKKKIMLPEFD